MSAASAAPETPPEWVVDDTVDSSDEEPKRGDLIAQDLEKKDDDKDADDGKARASQNANGSPEVENEVKAKPWHELDRQRWQEESPHRRVPLRRRSTWISIP
jgi:hypothetical protein